MIHQLDLFDQTTLGTTLAGSIEWKRAKYNELTKMSYEEVKKINNELFAIYDTRKPNTEEYWTLSVVIDVLHSFYYEKFLKDYPNIMFGKRTIKYL